MTDDQFARNIDSYNVNLTTDISDYVGKNFKDIETSKRQIEFLINEKSPNRIKLLKLKGEKGSIESVAFPIISKLSDEIQISIQFYNSNNDQQITELNIVGGGALLKGIDKFLETTLKIPVKIINPTDDLKIKNDKISNSIIYRVAPRLATAIGQAKAVLDPSININVNLQKKIKYKDTQRSKNIKYVMLLLGFIIITMFTFSQNFKAKAIKYQSTIKTKNRFIKELELKIDELKEYSILGNEVNLQVNKIQSLKESQPQWSVVLQKISTTIPESVWLTQIIGSYINKSKNDIEDSNNIKYLKLKLIGFTINPNKVQQFISELEKCEEFNKAVFTKITSTNQGTDGRIRFQVEGNIEIISEKLSDD